MSIREAPPDRRRLLRLHAALSEALARGGAPGVVLQATCQAIVDQLGAAFARIWTLKPAALRGLGAALGARHRVVVRCDLGPEPALEIGSKETLFRICQEALNNVGRHARATAVDIQLAEDGVGVVQLAVSDDGVSFDVGLERPGHVGLRSMRERAEARGWSFEVRSEPGAGTSVSVRTSPAEA